MPTFNASNAQCQVFTQKEGFLSAIAHDLAIEVQAFTISVNGDFVSASIQANSLSVLHATKDGKPIEALSEKDKLEIKGNIAKDVLLAAKYPEITFASTVVQRDASDIWVEGNLGLHGVTRSIRFRVVAAGDTYVAEIPIHQPDFGIKPYTAMLGALKVKADLTVRVTLPRW